MRSNRACERCRSRKVKCINDGSNQQPCRDCASLDLKCVYVPIGKQGLFRSGRVTKPTSWKPNTLIFPSVIPRAAKVLTGDETDRVRCKIPSKKILIEAGEIFFKNQYQGIFPFIHKPTFTSTLQSSEFNLQAYMQQSDFNQYPVPLAFPEPIVILAMLALCARFHSDLIQQYGDFDESRPHEIGRSRSTRDGPSASKYFGWHARQMLLDDFDRPSIQRIQALVMLSSHEWGECNVARSFMYVGIASRMALIMGLGYNEGPGYNNEVVMDSGDIQGMDFVMKEMGRRTIWSCFMMDRCIASGRRRSPSLLVGDIQIALPCIENDFYFGFSSGGLTYRNLLDIVEGRKSPRKPVSHFAFTILLFELWHDIARWTGERDVRKDSELPWDPLSQFFRLSSRLDNWSQLPNELKWSQRNLHAHVASQSAGSFGYLNSMYFLCRIFLNREYMFLRPRNCPAGWWKNNMTQLIGATSEGLKLISAMASMDVAVIAPFTGFEVFTFTGMSSYLNAYLFDPHVNSISNVLSLLGLEQSGTLKTELPDLYKVGQSLLRKWKLSWGIATVWEKMLSKIHTDLASALETGSFPQEVKDYGRGEVFNDEYSTRGIEIMKISSIAEEQPLVASGDSLLEVMSPSWLDGWDSFREINELWR
jgi:Fungal specific transcription factor domain/Fungal Zn(2)-Cys(6) binuclear cluster domain